jgi:hypothetical protein
LKTEKSLVPIERIENVIIVLHGHKVILDEQLALLYDVEVKVLNQAVKRNIERFPKDFMFQLTYKEVQRSRSQIVTLNTDDTEINEYSGLQSIKSKRGSNIKYLPYAFTEQGVAMLSSVLRSPRAVQVNIEIMRAFVRLRQMLQSNRDLARKLEKLEKKYDTQFKVVFDAIRELMAPPTDELKHRIGFNSED